MNHIGILQQSSFCAIGCALKFWTFRFQNTFPSGSFLSRLINFTAVLAFLKTAKPKPLTMNKPNSGEGRRTCQIVAQRQRLFPPSAIGSVFYAVMPRAQSKTQIHAKSKICSSEIVRALCGWYSVRFVREAQRLSNRFKTKRDKRQHGCDMIKTLPRIYICENTYKRARLEALCCRHHLYISERR